MRPGELPGWVNLGLLPLLNLAAAFLVSGLIVLVLGENPLEAVRLLIFGSFGYAEAIGYTLFYATSFIFTGLAVAIAFHCGLFNIGGEGQAYVGGLGVVLVGLHWLAALAGGGAACNLGSRCFRRLLGVHPWLASGPARQPRRDHHDHVQFHCFRAHDVSPG